MFFERDSNSTVTKIEEINNLLEVSYNETNYKPMFLLTDARHYFNAKSDIKYDDDLKRFITIVATSKLSDYSVSPPVIKEYDIGIRVCTLDDFKTE